MHLDLSSVEPHRALQQPAWEHDPRLPKVRRELAARPALVSATDVRRLRAALARVARGEAHVVVAGDCAEDPAECTGGYVARKAGLLEALAGTLKMVTHTPVLRVGRIAGQFAKPRSRPTETVAGRELPSFRGHLVNGPEPDAREPDPTRMLTCYDAAAAALDLLTATAAPDLPPWTGHEALVLDYELPLVREDGRGGLMLGSTHWPWIGERTRQPDGAHVALLSSVSNPVACKVGPACEVSELLELCARLDPRREPGRLTLVARMGAGRVAERLPGLVRAVRAAGHPVIWLTDPMHGNTVTTPDGLKTRYVETVATEITAFQQAVRAAGGIAGGVHLETTPDEVTECVPNAAAAASVAEKYTTFCDPRLNPGQARAALTGWQP